MNAWIARCESDEDCDWKSSVYLDRENAETSGENHIHQFWLEKVDFPENQEQSAKDDKTEEEILEDFLDRDNVVIVTSNDNIERIVEGESQDD